MPGQVQGMRRTRRTSTSLRPSPSFGKIGSLRPKKQQTLAAGSRQSQKKGNKLLDSIRELSADKNQATEVLTIESFIERSKNNEII